MSTDFDGDFDDEANTPDLDFEFERDLDFDDLLEDDINELLPPGDRVHTSGRQKPSMSFDLGPHNQFLIPLSSTISKSETDLPKHISFWSSLSLIVGMSIGSGIFASPGVVFEHSGSVGSALLVWVVGGVLAIAGGLCYAELGTSMPSSGAEHPYLLRAFGSLPAFLFGFSGVTVTRPGSVAIITIICAEYIVRLLMYANPTEAPPAYLIKLIALVSLIALTLLNCISTKLGTLVQDVFTVLKVASLAIIGAIGIVKLLQSGAFTSTIAEGREAKPIFEGSSSNPGDYALALYSALWAYDGWNNLNLVTGELQNPSRDLPRAVILGPSIVIVAYVLANMAYFTVLPATVITTSNTIGMSFGKFVFGHVGAIIIPLVVIGSTIGASNASIFSGSRVAYVSARAAHLPKFLGKIHPRFRTPFNALIFQSAFSAALILFGDFRSLVNFYSMVAWFFYLLAVLALLKLRRTEPHMERPYRVWTPVAVAFLVSVVFLITLSVAEAPGAAVSALLFLGSGVPVWYVVVYKKLGWEGIAERISTPCGILLHKASTFLPTSLAPRKWTFGGYRRQASQEDGMEMEET
ncbi:amino acid permease-domain-containing protein [Fimicolochytrium jonesii]|uniref:amino acid permease-domain-containing protein n=1 Tax=Fimicolochytrium jonesii TaxID=1396493 RepID=UPI0022FF22A5|nr:amino acid permease-domain-containing protein [Fimicolochytrium jonesii]KAI8827090.1 amino acid permease-domain-containing protein [Fimicolochytrium jonesii]